jgi:hypothetical protein
MPRRSTATVTDDTQSTMETRGAGSHQSSSSNDHLINPSQHGANRQNNSSQADANLTPQNSTQIPTATTVSGIPQTTEQSNIHQQLFTNTPLGSENSLNQGDIDQDIIQDPANAEHIQTPNTPIVANSNNPAAQILPAVTHTPASTVTSYPHTVASINEIGITPHVTQYPIQHFIPQPAFVFDMQKAIDGSSLNFAAISLGPSNTETFTGSDRDNSPTFASLMNEINMNLRSPALKLHLSPDANTHLKIPQSERPNGDEELNIALAYPNPTDHNIRIETLKLEKRIRDWNAFDTFHSNKLTVYHTIRRTIKRYSECWASLIRYELGCTQDGKQHIPYELIQIMRTLYEGSSSHATNLKRQAFDRLQISTRDTYLSYAHILENQRNDLYNSGKKITDETLIDKMMAALSDASDNAIIHFCINEIASWEALPLTQRAEAYTWSKVVTRITVLQNKLDSIMSCDNPHTNSAAHPSQNKSNSSYSRALLAGNQKTFPRLRSTSSNVPDGAYRNNSNSIVRDYKPPPNKRVQNNYNNKNANTSRNQPRGRRRVICGHCGFFGHTAENCKGNPNGNNYEAARGERVEMYKQRGINRSDSNSLNDRSHYQSRQHGAAPITNNPPQVQSYPPTRGNSKPPTPRANYQKQYPPKPYTPRSYVGGASNYNKYTRPRSKSRENDWNEPPTKKAGVARITISLEAASLDAQLPANAVVLDSGSEHHLLTPNFAEFWGMAERPAEPMYIQFGAGDSCLSNSVIDFGIMRNARIVQNTNMFANLLSLSCLTMNGYKCEIDQYCTKVYIYDYRTNKKGRCVLTAPKYGGLYACTVFDLTADEFEYGLDRTSM